MKNCKDELYRIKKSYNKLKNKLMFAEKEIEKANKRAETFEFLATRLTVAIDCPRCPVKDTIPQMKMPQFIFVPMVEWLRDKYGIRFMEEKEND